MMHLILRNETLKDHLVVENLTREAFWNHHTPGCVEHYLIHVMRDSDAFIAELDFVAEVDGRVVGNIVYAKSNIIGENGENIEVLTFGPVSVLPEFQGKGIGSRLIEHTMKLAREMRFRGILIYGDPDYYSKFSFVPAEKFGIGTSDDMYAVALQACELFPGALSGCAGRFFEGSIYEVDEAAAEDFDKGFPPRERVTGSATQDRFLQLVGMRRPRKE